MSFSLEGTQGVCSQFLQLLLNIKNTSLRDATHERDAKQTRLAHVSVLKSHQPRGRSRGLPANRHLICSGGFEQLHGEAAANKHWRKGQGEDKVGLR